MFVMKMPPRKRKKRSFVAVVFLIMFGMKFTNAQMISEEDSPPPAAQASQSTAFFALRSCHQVLGGDSGHFFSPDYLCSNPPLWCNWTIQVHPGKRVQLQLSDLTPDDSCHRRRDQIHIEEPESQPPQHSILQNCWGEETYTSLSNTVHVVLLIEGSPMPNYRGFYGQYQAFGPPQVYNPQNPGFSPSGADENMEEIVNYMNEETMDTNLLLEDNIITDNETEEQSVSDSSEIIEETHSPDLHLDLSPRVNTAIRRNADKEATTVSDVEAAIKTSQSEEEMISQSDDRKREEAGHGDLNENLKQDIDSLPEEEEEEEEEETSPPERREPQFDLRADTRVPVRPHHQSPHLPGDFLFEVSVEVNVSRDSEPWNDVAQTLLLSVKNLIRNQLKPTLASQSISSKRIKRLNGGVLFILWLQIGQRTSGHRAHEVVHSSLQRLIGSRLGFRPNQDDSVIMSLSTADVNECDSQLVLCDPNADCMNHFGSYSCQCQPDYEDQSRSGTGMVCVDIRKPDCSSSLSSEAKAVFVLFFLLSVLVLSLLVLMALFYHRHRRGHFQPPPDVNNNSGGGSSSGHHDDGDIPPPPPPRCPPVDLQLLRYNAIMSHETKACPTQQTNK